MLLGIKHFLTGYKVTKYRGKNNFPALKIYFHGLIIYFQGLVIYFQSLKIILNAVEKNFIRRTKMFCIGYHLTFSGKVIVFYLEYVPEALAADDVAGVGTKLLAEAGDMDVDGAVGDDDTIPDAVH